jgi:maleylacetoacetate isomerase/maleylpyruvate isomerase
VILHNFSLSSASYRVRIALNLKGLAYETRNYKLRAGEQRSAEYLKINPAGLVPTLEIDGLRLSQSVAIIDYLDATRPVPRLIPADPSARARSMAIALTIACDIHPINNLRVLMYLEKELQQSEAVRDAWYAAWVAQGFSALEAMLTEKSDTLYADGPEPGLADVCLVPQVYNARRYKVDMTPYPRLVEVADRAAQLKAFADSAPVS